MFIEIEETVCFIASFLYGKIPRSRVDSFAEAVANGLVDRIYTRSEPLKSYSLVVNVDENKDNLIEENTLAHANLRSVQAASCAFISLRELSKLLPANLLLELREGSVHAVNADTGNVKCIYPVPGYCNEGNRRNGRRPASRATDSRRRPCFRVEFAYPKGSERDERAVAKPNFEVERSEQIYSAQAFAATRFGSTKLKTYQSSQCGDNGYGHHPFTMPSVYAYLRLLVFLNVLACATMIQGIEEGAETQKSAESSDDEKKRLLEETHGDRASSGFVDDDELSDPVNEKSDTYC
nr:Anti-proliferative protein domain containing protein [Haemonchus contortus]